jgi:hypothetical protein
MGIIMSLTRESTIFANATPIITPIARSITLPLRANSLNSEVKLMLTVLVIKKANILIRFHKPKIVTSCRFLHAYIVEAVPFKSVGLPVPVIE